MSDFLEYALRYAGAGFRVMPVRGKVPLTKHGAHDASTDTEQITRWWEEWPSANIAISLDGYVAVDIDPRNGGDPAHLEHELPETCFAQTGGGGSHHLYVATATRYPKTLSQGIDLKFGAGQYIVVEPSIHESGGRYVWIDETEPWGMRPRAAPAWIAYHGPNGDKPPPTLAQDGQLREGGRNNALASMAGSMRRRGMSAASIEAALQAENIAQCVPALPTTEVSLIAASVARYSPAEIPEQEKSDSEQAPSHEWPVPLDLVAMARREPVNPQFIIPDWLPCGYATLLAGHGGAGKSSIALHLAVCMAAALEWHGMTVSQRRVLYLSCEDREDILHWRLARICRHLSLDLASVCERLKILDLVGHEVTLWSRDPRTGHTYTPAFARLSERIEEYQSEVLFIDGITDVYDGSEISRGEVKRFVNSMISLIPPDRGAVLLVGHVNRPTAAAGASAEGYSGSTSWHNSVRARWYLCPQTADAGDGRAEKTGELTLELQKSNLGRSDQQIRLSWDDTDNLFVGRSAGGESGLMRSLRETSERDGILKCLRICATSGLYVPAATTGRRTAHHVLSAQPGFPESLLGSSAAIRRFWRRMEEMRAIGIIREAAIRRDDRHSISVLVEKMQ